MEKGMAYRSLLIQAIHSCATKVWMPVGQQSRHATEGCDLHDCFVSFCACVPRAAQFPDVADSVVHVLMDFLNGEGAMDVIIFVRAIVEQYPPLRASVLGKLISSIREIKCSSVLCVALWVLGTYCEGADSIAQVSKRPSLIIAVERGSQVLLSHRVNWSCTGLPLRIAHQFGTVACASISSKHALAICCWRRPLLTSKTLLGQRPSNFPRSVIVSGYMLYL